MEGTDPVASLPIPSSYLVLQKLKEWDECQTRAPNNTSDQSTRLARKELTNLLQTLRYSEPKFHHDPTYDRDLHNESAPRVHRFIAAHNIYMNEWRQMGFGEGPRLRASGASTRAGGTSTSAVPEAPVQPRQSNLGHMQIRRLAAQTTVAILTELGLPCTIFGSMACKLYGNQRIPNVRAIYALKVRAQHLH